MHDEWDGQEDDDPDALSLDEAVARLGLEQDVIPTGFAPLDSMLRNGGLPAGRVVAIGGPPGAGKTTLATMMLNSMSPRMPAVGLFADEGRDAATVKLGQQLGYKREDLERGAPELLPFIRERMKDTYKLPDPDSPKASVLSAVKVLEALSGNGGPRLLVLDSVQTIPLDGDQDLDPDDRLAITQFCYATRRETKIRQWITVMTGQANYESFKHKSDAKNLNPLAAFAGSRAIVYSADLCIVFGIPDDDDICKVYVPKNRLGKKGHFVVKLDRERAMLLQVDPAELEDVEARQAEEKTEAAKKCAAKILAKLAKFPGQTSRQLTELTGTRKEAVVKALSMLVDEGKIKATPAPRNSFLYDLA